MRGCSDWGVLYIWCVLQNEGSFTFEGSFKYHVLWDKELLCVDGNLVTGSSDSGHDSCSTYTLQVLVWRWNVSLLHVSKQYSPKQTFRSNQFLFHYFVCNKWPVRISEWGSKLTWDHTPMMWGVCIHITCGHTCRSKPWPDLYLYLSHTHSCGQVYISI